jgi:uncharacterized Zn finger protein
MTTAYRPDRLHRAWQLVTSGCVERLGGTQYRVAGNVEPDYYVDLMGDQPCTCRDMEYRGTAILHNCKHVLAARLAALDPALLQVIGDALAKKEALAKEARKLARRQRRATR